MGLASKIKNASSGYDYPPQQQSTGPGSYGGTPPQQQPTGPYGSASEIKKPSSGYDYPPQHQSTGPYGPGGYGGTPPQQQPTGPYGSDSYGGVPPAHYAYPAASAPPQPQQYYGSGSDYPASHKQAYPPSHVESSPYGVQGHVQTPSDTQGMYSHPPAGAGARPSSMQPANVDMLAQKLQSIIQANGLHAFYDQGRFQATLQRVATINFAEIAAQWKIGRELAYDLAPLALYDIVFYCDDSGSMAFEEGGERIDDLKFILSKVAGISTKFDDDGIRVRFMNSEVNGDGINSAAAVEQLISRVKFSGMTPLGTNLERKVIQPFVLGQAMSNMAKPVLAIIITDGEPSGEDRGTIRQVIQHAKDALMKTRYGGGAFAVQIAQVGKDAKTQKFLESLDKDPVVGGMIDCTSYYELEEQEFARKGVTLTPELWLLKMCVGAIDREYDSKDT